MRNARDWCLFRVSLTVGIAKSPSTLSVPIQPTLQNVNSFRLAASCIQIGSRTSSLSPNCVLQDYAGPSREWTEAKKPNPQQYTVISSCTQQTWGMRELDFFFAFSPQKALQNVPPLWPSTIHPTMQNVRGFRLSASCIQIDARTKSLSLHGVLQSKLGQAENGAKERKHLDSNELK